MSSHFDNDTVFISIKTQFCFHHHIIIEFCFILWRKEQEREKTADEKSEKSFVSL